MKFRSKKLPFSARDRINMDTLTAMLLLIVGFWHPTTAMVYDEPINIEDLDSLFSDDDCIDGTLSTTESGSPLINTIAFIDIPTVTVVKANSEFDWKSPMTMVSELSSFNKIKYQYILKEEDGPSHRKRFLISLILGDEEYSAEGSSIKRAQHEAAKLALNSTTYEHPPINLKKDKAPKQGSANTPEHKLNKWARKHSGVTVIYTYIQQTHVSHNNFYHQSMYSKSQNVYKVTVTVGDQQFTGEGYSAEVAKQNAAGQALKQLQSAEGFCMFNDGIKNVFAKLFSSDSESTSPISLLHEFSAKSKLELSFDLVSEEGPSHIKKFVYKCTVDKFETFGEGSSKKTAKLQAAEMMVQKLKSHSLYNQADCKNGLSLMKRKPKKNKSRNLIKAVTQKTQDGTDYDLTIPEDMNPIAKLMQIQQHKHDVEPIFRLVGEDTQDLSKRFSIEVTVGELSFVGFGPNKKTAKRTAAEGMLVKLGYSTISGTTRVSSLNSKKKEFSDDNTILKKKPLVPGLNLNFEKFSKFDNASPAKDDKTGESNKASKSTDNTKDSKNKKTSSVRPKTELQKLAQQQGFRFQFSDFPKLNNTGFVSLVSLTTDPPKVCYGSGVTTELSQDRASLSALENLYKNQLNTISQMLRESSFDTPAKQEFYMVDGNTVIKTIASKETKNL